MDLGIEGKVTIVSGGARGIGEAVVRCVAGERGIPVVADRAHEAGRDLVAELAQAGCDAHHIEADLRDVDACRRVVAETLDRFAAEGIDVQVKLADTVFGIPSVYVVGAERDPSAAPHPLVLTACGEAAPAPAPVVVAGSVRFGNALPLALIAGPCAMESRAHALETAAALIAYCRKLRVPIPKNGQKSLHKQKTDLVLQIDVKPR